MESKEHQKKRGIRSSDCADALGLTFSLPDSAITANINSKQSETLQYLAADMSKRKKLLERARYK